MHRPIALDMYVFNRTIIGLDWFFILDSRCRNTSLGIKRCTKSIKALVAYL